MNEAQEEWQDETIEPKKPPLRFKDSVLAKIASIAILMLILLIPLGMIDSLLDERLMRRNTTMNEITATWGKAQTLVGPVLIIPYRYSYLESVEEIRHEGNKEIKQMHNVMQTKAANAYFLPSHLSVQGDLKPNQLHRGIYTAIVYTGNLKMTAQFAQPDFAGLKITGDILWNEASLSFALSDLRGTHETLMLEVDKQKLALIPGSLVPNFISGVQTHLNGLLNKDKKNLTVGLNLELNGSSGLQVAPLGIQNEVNLQSTWPDPSFSGAFLPTQRDISAQGFKAQWQVSYYGRDYPQQWTSESNNNEVFNTATVENSLFGVTLVSPIDSYRNVERSIKYGILFVTLVFTAFFLFEVSGKIKIHPFQYLLVGAALCLFYLALLSLSEFIPFLLAYLIAAAISTLLITLYSKAVLKNGKRSLLMAGGLLTTYSFLYVTLQATDYALLTGTAGLCCALSLVMYITRNIDWYAPR